jgi:hypothetical protein
MKINKNNFKSLSKEEAEKYLKENENADEPVDVINELSSASTDIFLKQNKCEKKDIDEILG